MTLSTIARRLCLLAALAPGLAAAAEPDVNDIMQRNYALGRLDSAAFDATFTLTSKSGQQRVRKTVGSSKLQANGVDQMRMTRFSAPADVAGMATLVLEHQGRDDDIWIYLPAMRKVRRLVADNRKDSFLGTDFSYADVIGYPVANWQYTFVKEDSVDGQPCYVIAGTPKNDAVKASSGYSKRLDWIAKANLVTLKSQFWDEAGQLLKNASFGDYRNLDAKGGKWQAMRLEAVNVQNGHRTLIEFGSYRVDQKVDERQFSAQALEQQ